MPSAYQLPIAGRFEAGGCKFVVRSLPYSLAKRVASAAGALGKGDTDTVAAIAADAWDRCVELEDGGEKPSADDVAQKDVLEAFNIALGTGAEEGSGPDFPAPPTSEGSGG
ncbi:MAG: hypothetical protein IKJ89_00320 [Kiritimatiellae bacterium]|nr:hypothetical protein [Kiritimatiellia bacterium]